jgi:hypothetical protein
MAVGAALGLLFGLLLLESVAVGLLLGVVGGALVGLIWQVQSNR